MKKIYSCLLIIDDWAAAAIIAVTFIAATVAAGKIIAVTFKAP